MVIAWRTVIMQRHRNESHRHAPEVTREEEDRRLYRRRRQRQLVPDAESASRRADNGTR